MTDGHSSMMEGASNIGCDWMGALASSQASAVQPTIVWFLHRPLNQAWVVQKMGFLTAGAHSLDTAHAAPDGGRPSSLPLALFPSTARPIPAPLLCSPAGEAPPPAPTTYLLRCRTCSPSCAHLPCSTGQRALRRRVRGTATPAPSTFPMPAMAGLAAARRPWWP